MIQNYLHILICLTSPCSTYAECAIPPKSSKPIWKKFMFDTKTREIRMTKFYAVHNFHLERVADLMRVGAVLM